MKAKLARTAFEYGVITGVTTMRMDEGLDTGDMIMKQEVIVDEDETGGSLFDNAKAGE